MARFRCILVNLILERLTIDQIRVLCNKSFGHIHLTFSFGITLLLLPAQDSECRIR